MRTITDNSMQQYAQNVNYFGCVNMKLKAREVYVLIPCRDKSYKDIHNTKSIYHIGLELAIDPPPPAGGILYTMIF